MEGRPDRPRTESRAELDFERRPMVRWLDPRELADAGLRVVLSSIFGAYADKREQFATLPDAVFDEASGRDSLWLDFVADVGDGFDPTYAVASALARPRIDVEHDGRRWQTERGALLVMGGDQVYPTAKRREYEDRTLGPYRAALPWVEPGSEPSLYAIPGNHDWYDGLTNYMRVFGQQRWVGGWRTRQHRSYFAVELPHGWWLWGIDIQFDAYIDAPQLAYFARARERLREGDRVILATSKPSWVMAGRGCDPDAAARRTDSYRNLAFFEEKLIRPSRARLALTLSGDLHHYARYEPVEGDGGQRITAGAGGAYVSPTHHLPAELALTGHRGEHPKRYARAAVWPPVERSRRMRWGALALPLGTPALSLVVGAVYALLALAVFVAVRDDAGGITGAAREQGLGALARDAVSPTSVLLAAALALALCVFADAPGWRRWAVGVAHAAVHVALAGLVALGAIEAVAELVPDASQPVAAAICVALAGVAGFFAGTFALALYLVLADWAFGARCERNQNYVFAAQSIRDWRCFLRLRIEPDGSLVVFPLGIRHVPRRWRVEPEGGPGDPWLVPEDRELEPQLIEAPIVVR